MKKLDRLWEMINTDPRIRHALIYGGVTSILELLQKNRMELMKMRGISHGTVSVIEHILLTGGKHLRTDPNHRCPTCGSLLPRWMQK